MIRRTALVLSLILSIIMCGTGVSACRLALALGLDVSGSVDSREYRLQLDGLAAALLHPDVVASLFALPAAPVRIAVFEWSGPEHQTVLVGWTEISDLATLEQVAASLRAVRRQKADPSTALGTAMATGDRLLAAQPDCWKRTLDISGDGMQNTGPHPRDVQAVLRGRAITINGLVIGADNPQQGDTRQAEIAQLSSYFRAWVLLGADAFVETALGFEDFEAAMVRKLKREMESPILSRLERPAPDQ